jgi:hypothetical protein
MRDEDRKALEQIAADGALPPGRVAGAAKCRLMARRLIEEFEGGYTLTDLGLEAISNGLHWKAS